MASNCLKVLNWNACSIKAKRIELVDFIGRHNIDVGLLTETHLTANDNFSVPNHSTVRLDRSHARGGGVAIIVKKGLRFTVLPHFKTTIIEAIGVELQTSTGSIRFVAAYCPRQCFFSNGMAAQFKNDLAAISRTKSKFIIGGDLNAKHELWKNIQCNQNGRLLFEHAQLGYYSVLFPEDATFVSPAGNPSTLDIFLSNTGVSKPAALNELTSDHFPVVCEVGANTAAAPVLQRKDYHRVNWERFSRMVDDNLADNPALDTTADIDDAIQELYQAIGVADVACVRRVPVRGKFTQLDSHTLSLIRLRNVYRRQFQRSGDLDKKSLATNLSLTIASRMDTLRNENFERVIQGLDDRSRSFWKISKVLKSKPKPIPPLTVDGSRLITLPEKTNAIGKQFASSHLLGSNICSPIEQQVAQCGMTLDATPCVVPPGDRVSVEQICSAVKFTKNMKAPGFDGIFNLILKKLSNKVYLLLCNIFNRCLDLSYFPATWKLAKIIPILKPGKDPTLPSSYRPISLLSAVSKLFERVILYRLENYISENNILPPVQFGFRRGHSTSHQLLRLINNIRANKAVSKSTAAAFLDIEKAFDNVWHGGLIYKLCNYNTPTYLTKIICSYLNQRQFRVSLSGVDSDIFPIPAGVPQGSLLGPILYNIYTSDLPQLPVGGQFFVFADDTSITVKGRKVCELRSRLQRCLDAFDEYAAKWKIKLNASKTQAIIFRHRPTPRLIPPPECKLKVCGSPVDWSSLIVYLGLSVDANLTFRQHVEKLIVRCAVLVGCLYPLICRKSRLSRTNKLAVFSQIISPVVYYASPVWGSCAKTYRKKIQVTLNRTLRMILNLPYGTRTTTLHQLANVQIVEDKLVLLKSKFREKCSISEYPMINTLFL